MLKEGMDMMPLTLANIGEESMILRIGGKPEVRAHLETLGFVPGGSVTVVSAIGGNLIVNVKSPAWPSARRWQAKLWSDNRF